MVVNCTNSLLCELFPLLWCRVRALFALYAQYYVCSLVLIN